MMIVVVQDSSQGSTEREQTARRSTERTLEMARACGATELAVASSGQSDPFTGIGVISYSERFPLGNAIAEFCRNRASEQVIMVSSELSSLSDATSTLRELMKVEGAFNYIPSLQGSLSVEFPGMSEGGLIPSQLMREFQPDMVVPAVGIKVERSLMIDTRFAAQSLAGMALELLIEAYHRGESIQAIGNEVTLPMNFNSIHMSLSDIARNLRRAIETLPIEELFPSYAWETRQSESAAQCYHSLAARFIRFKDYESAESCLTQADLLEESPRAMALRAVIAMDRGETLGAIAKLIASLQEYEQRKRTTDKVEATSETNGIENVNQELKAGLSALNSQDNPTALKHFARAVREFDSFYRDSGLLLLL